MVRVDASSTKEADALMCAARPGGDLLRGTRDPRQARERILAARAAGLASATADTSTPRVPSRPAVVAVLGALATVSGFLVGGS